MNRLLLALLFFLVPLCAGELLTLDEASYLLKKKQTKSVHQAYHAFKNIRINAIMEGDTVVQKKALQGIVNAGKLLHVDVIKYSDELANLGASNSQSKEQKPNTDTTSSVNNLLSARWKYGNIVLNFKNKILENQVHYFILDKKFNNKYRYVFDIKANAQKTLSLSNRHLSGLRLNQNRKNNMRLVIENSTPISLTYLRKGRELIIRVGKKGENITQKMVTQQNALEKKERPKGQKVIVIDPGHGGKDGGAVGYRKYREKVIVFDIAQQLKRELRNLGYKVYITRDRDKFIELRKRTAYANKRNADLFISIHANSVPRKSGYSRHHGVETYFLAPSDSKRAKSVAATENTKDVAAMNHFGKESFLNFLNKQKILASNKLAIDLQKGMLSILRRSYSKIRDGGVRKGPFWVLVGAQMPAVLVEVGFITNPKEARHLVNKTYQKRLAHGLALGVENYFRMN